MSKNKKLWIAFTLVISILLIASWVFFFMLEFKSFVEIVDYLKVGDSLRTATIQRMWAKMIENIILTVFGIIIIINKKKALN